jgi:hypothetical protein
LVKDKEKSNYFIYGMENTSVVNLDPNFLAMRVIIWSGIINKTYIVVLLN